MPGHGVNDAQLGFVNFFACICLHGLLDCVACADFVFGSGQVDHIACADFVFGSGQVDHIACVDWIRLCDDCVCLYLACWIAC